MKTKFFNDVRSIHKTYHKFSNWLAKTYGKDLWSKYQYHTFTNKQGRKEKIKYRNFDFIKLSQRITGYDVMCKIKKYIDKYCPDIKIIGCDDSVYAGSYILLIPHPRHGITVMFIPQCTDVQNQFFLYKGHYQEFIKELKKMNSVYNNSI